MTDTPVSLAASSRIQRLPTGGFKVNGTLPWQEEK